MPLTDAKIRNTKPRQRTHLLYDSGGLHLEVSPAGGKWWRLKYRFNGKSKRLSLGVYPEVSLADARERRDEARKLLAKGVDPSAAKKAQKAAQIAADVNTFEKIGRAWFRRFSPLWIPSYSVRKLSRLERDVFPFLGARPIAEIAPAEILSTLQRIEARGAVESAHRILTDIKAVFSFAIASGIEADRLKANPAGELRKALAPADENNFAAVVKPEELAPILRAFESYNGTMPVSSALRLMPLLAVRPGELRHMEWAEVDLENARWEIPAEKMKMRLPHIVPLSKQAVAILREIQPLTGKGKYVFPSGRGMGRPMSDAAILAAMRNLGIPKDVTTGHGFRASFRTIADEVLKIRVDWIEHQLAHAVKDANGRSYNRTTFLPERAAMMQRWADYLDGLKATKLLEFPSAASA